MRSLRSGILNDATDYLLLLAVTSGECGIVICRLDDQSNAIYQRPLDDLTPYLLSGRRGGRTRWTGP